jgi:hypothetical protein
VVSNNRLSAVFPFSRRSRPPKAFEPTSIHWWAFSIRQGAESDQPTAIFKDNDNVSGKLVDIPHLIYDAPDNVGPMPLVTPGREGNFTWLSNQFKHYVAGRYYFPQNFIGTGTAGAVSAGRLYGTTRERRKRISSLVTALDTS